MNIIFGARPCFWVVARLGPLLQRFALGPYSRDSTIWKASVVTAPAVVSKVMRAIQPRPIPGARGARARVKAPVSFAGIL